MTTIASEYSMYVIYAGPLNYQIHYYVLMFDFLDNKNGPRTYMLVIYVCVIEPVDLDPDCNVAEI